MFVRRVCCKDLTRASGQVYSIINYKNRALNHNYFNIQLTVTVSHKYQILFCLIVD